MIERYETEAMRSLWDEEAKFSRWTQVEIAACEAFHERGEISSEDIEAIRKGHHQSAARVSEHEKVTNHDVVAFVRAMGETVGDPARRHIHRGLTSSDIVDTALAMGMRDSLDTLINATAELRVVIGKQANTYKLTPCAGRTHGVHAEPTTFGLRLAGWFSEMSRNLARLKEARRDIAHAKLSGAVGNYSQTDPDFEASVMDKLGLQVEPVSTQVVPRDRHATVLNTLAVLGAGIERFATEMRSLQRTDIREAEEYFAPGQTGSSAMPHKRNPITGERLSGMARLLRGYAVSAMENVALWHDRDISHSSVERVIVPDAFHVAHYMVLKTIKLIDKMFVYPENMVRNMDRTKGLLFSQSALGTLLEAGMERQDAYRVIQAQAMRVWAGEEDHLKHALANDPTVAEKVESDKLDDAFKLDRYLKHVDAIFQRVGLNETDLKGEHA